MHFISSALASETQNGDPRHGSQREAMQSATAAPRYVLGGQPAYFIVYRMKLYEDYPDGVIFKEVETKYRNRFYFILYSEDGKDRARIAAINTPKDWTLSPIFEA